MVSVRCFILSRIIEEHVYPFKFTDVVTTTTHVPPRTKGGHDLLQAGRADGDGALRQDHGVSQEAQLWAQPGALRPRARCAEGLRQGIHGRHHQPALAAETAAALTASQPDYASPPSGNSLCGARK
ncbi:hypothetical protein VPH35_059851 [Triticum aestivum]